MKKIFQKVNIISFCIVLSSQAVIAQNYSDLSNCKIVGNNGEIVPYATIKISNTYIYAQSDENGCFTIEKIPKLYFGDSLKVSHIAFRDTTVSISAVCRDMQIKLTPKQNYLSSVSVVGISKKSQIDALKVISNAYQNLKQNYSDSIYSRLGDFKFLTKQEYSQDTVRYAVGIAQLSLPYFIHKFQAHPNQTLEIAEQYDYRKSILQDLLSEKEDVQKLLPLAGDLEYITYSLLAGDCEYNFPLKKNNLDDNVFNIEDTVKIDNSVFFKLVSMPKKTSAGLYRGEFIIDTLNYSIREIRLSLIRHINNKAISMRLGSKKGGVIIFPIYDNHIEVLFNKDMNNSKMYIESADIDLVFSVKNTSKGINSNRFITNLKILNFNENQTSVRSKTPNREPNKIQKIAMKKVEKIIKKLEN